MPTYRRIEEDDVEEVVAFSLVAWEPVFASFERVLGKELFERMRPDWKTEQRNLIESVCKDPSKEVWVAEQDGSIVGFTALQVNDDTGIGEVYLVAVVPERQRSGVGTALNEFAFERLKDAGMEFVEVHTGSDPGHAPARRSYEKAGFEAIDLHPIIYIKKC
jgi:ribosomal protein S18 acetylase RimI-like enzyme